jgi:signal peptidase I/ribosomal protein S27AE
MTLKYDSQDKSVPPGNDPPFNPDRRGAVRSLTDSFISLFIAVLLFRTFAAEGYMISTGSMAPCLLGFHKRVECPRCGAQFAFGVAYDTDDPNQADELARARNRAVCPNCGQSGIDLRGVPRNHGDQLLVNKQAYLYRSPQRWEIIVFRNPARPTEAYVKRVAGLPGESLQIDEGDVLIDGRLVRKDYAQQLAMRILVHDHDHRPGRDSGFEPHWRLSVDDEAASPPGGVEPAGWKPDGDGFVLRQGDERRPDHEPYRWIEYRHWIRSGGMHETSVPLDEWPAEAPSSTVPAIGLRYDPEMKKLSFTGALPESALKRILALTEDERFHTAMRDLYNASHVTPLTDDYGYNPVEGGAIPNTVRDAMVSCRVRMERGAGDFAIQMTDGLRNFACVMDGSRREIRLLIDHDPQPVAVGDWPASFDKGAPTVEMSLIDQQIVVAVDGQPVLQPWPIETPVGTPVPRCAVRIGGRGLDLRVDRLRLYRDVYYTSSGSRNGVNRPCVLGEDEFFVLGDNSPVSHDSRRWEEAPVHRSLLLGKPFLVHLPSKPGRLRIGSYEMHLRLPDTERIRFLK